MSKRIEITVDNKGNSQVETKGFAGSECVEASKAIVQALGNAVKESVTPEFYNTASSNTSVSMTNDP